MFGRREMCSTFTNNVSLGMLGIKVGSFRRRKSEGLSTTFRFSFEVLITDMSQP